MKELKGECQFYVFSDDIEWTRQNIKCDGATYVDKTGSEFIDLALMMKCKNFIIPNSTFSWWAQYLSNAPDKIVIAPEIWLNDEGPRQNGVYLDNWVCLNPYQEQ